MKNRFFKILICILAFTVSVFSGCVNDDDTDIGDIDAPFPADTYEDMDIYEDMTPTFRDEFDNNRLNPEKWECEEGGFWSNEEIQYYSPDKATVSEGLLHITAEKDPRTFTRGDTETVRKYGSARIRTRNRFFQKYGRFEASISLPAVEGLWPAFWMMPENNFYGGWPVSGEIDIMEARGRQPYYVDQTIHFGGYGNRHKYKGDNYEFSEAEGSIEEFHVYAIEWREDQIEWFVDGRSVFKVRNLDWYTDSVPNKGDNINAPFDKEFFMILNLAVGGKYDGGREPPDSFESADMLVDYVRVWQYK